MPSDSLRHPRHRTQRRRHRLLPTDDTDTIASIFFTSPSLLRPRGHVFAILTSLTRYRSYKKQASCFCGEHRLSSLISSQSYPRVLHLPCDPFSSSRDRHSPTSFFILPPSLSPDSASCSGNRRLHLCPVS